MRSLAPPLTAKFLSSLICLITSYLEYEVLIDFYELDHFNYCICLISSDCKSHYSGNHNDVHIGFIFY
jgi:hypothetical protein